MNKEDKQTALGTILKVSLALLPGVGGALGELLSDTLAQRKEERLKEFLQGLENKIQLSRERLNTEFVSKGDFLDVFEQTAKKIMNERSREKRLAYQNILLKGILDNQHNYDDIEYQMRLLDQLTKDHLLLLSLFFNPKMFNKNNDLSKLRKNTFLALFKLVLPLWDYDFLFDHLRDLENQRLIEPVTNSLKDMSSGFSIERFSSLLTSRGRSFISYIME